jgi:hypothetical protein
MSDISVGQSIKLGGRPFRCNYIQTTERTCIADCTGFEERAVGVANNCKMLTEEIEDFSKGDIVEYKFQMVNLEPLDAGPSFRIYTYFKARKVT